MSLPEEQKIRYSRNILIKEIGGIGQQKLLQSKVLVVGAGGLGSPVIMYLAAAGVGTLGIIDNDNVHESNLNRQVLHSEKDLNRPKVISAKEFVNDFNPAVNVKHQQVRLTIDNVLELIDPYDCVVDCMDTLPLKFLLNDACVESKKPFIHAGVVALHGQQLTVLPGKTACMRCLFPVLPDEDFGPTSAEVGILGSCAGVLGSLEATAVIRLLAGADMPGNLLLVYDGLGGTFKSINVERKTDCPVCGPGKMLEKENYAITRTFSD
jgi:adenylyltransferase/sulfurtransferase